MHRKMASVLLVLLFSLAFVLGGCNQPPTPKAPEQPKPEAAPVTAPAPEAAPQAAQQAAAPAMSAAPEPAPAAAPAGVDEFGVSTSDTPPPMPKGYESTQAVYAAIAKNEVMLIEKDKPAPESVGVVVTKDVEYGRVGDRPLLCDMYVSKDIQGPAPCLVFIHGGGWSGGDRADYSSYCVAFAKRGYVVATISYRFSGEAPFPAAVQDAKCAIRFLRANAAKLNINADRIAVMGGSAGGHLAMMIGYSSDVPELEGDGGNPGVSSKIACVINAYGPTDLTAPEAKDASSVTSFLKKKFDEDPAVYRLASPLTHLTPDDPPTLIIQGTVDDTVPVVQNDLLAAKLKELNIPSEYLKFEGWPHTLDLAQEPNKVCQWHIIHFLNKYMPAKH